MRRNAVPSGLRTLLQAKAGDWVVVDSVLRRRGVPRCIRCALEAGTVVLVRDVGPEGVILGMPDGTDLLLDPTCAGAVQTEPANGPGARAGRRSRA